MNGKTILKLVAVVGLAKLVMGGHRHRMAPQKRGNWQNHIAELHRELHRRDAEAGSQASQAASTPSPDAA